MDKWNYSVVIVVIDAT